jgi:hypothetical protein
MMTTKVWALMMVLLMTPFALADFVIYQDDFSGTGSPLNGTAPDVRPGSETWAANGPFRDNGTIDGTIEGGALLPITLGVNQQYTLSMDVFMPTGVDRWVALGFAQDPLVNTNADEVNNRHPNETEGIAWMLYRDSATNADDVQAFKGRRNQQQIADTATSLTFGVSRKLSIVLDTTGDGNTFTADFRLDGTSIVGGPQLINSLSNPGGAAVVPGTLLDQIRWVGFSYDDSTANAPSVDNFMLTSVPEIPGWVAGAVFMTGLVGLSQLKRNRKPPVEGDV